MRSATPARHGLGILGLVAVTTGMIGLATSDTGRPIKGPTPPPIETAVATNATQVGGIQIVSLSLPTEPAASNPTHPVTTVEPTPSDPVVSAQKLHTEPERPRSAIENITAAKPAPDQIKTAKVRAGDNMAVLFRRLGLRKDDLHRILAHQRAAKTLGNIYPGQIIEAHISPQGRLSTLRYDLGGFEFFTVTFDGNDLQIKQTLDLPETRIAAAEGAIHNNLFASAAKAGLSDKQIMELADIFAWDVDFARDIRQGDRFALLYEVLYRNDERVGAGRILAAEFINNGQTHRAVHFDHQDRGGYYDPKGRPMRKAFLRSPVNFTRISSGFSLKRWHPKLHRFRAHKGVDYAAPRGTAIQASGEGRITFAGKKNGYGRVVIIQHGQRYSTLYAHMHRIKKGVRAGKRVQQGQVIGTVGSSGLATGPHLHYEFRIDGVHRNPLKVKFPEARPLPRTLMARFRNQTSGHLTQLAKLTSTHLANRD